MNNRDKIFGAIFVIIYLYSIYDTIMWFKNIEKGQNENLNFINLFCIIITIFLIMGLCIAGGGPGVIII